MSFKRGVYVLQLPYVVFLNRSAFSEILKEFKWPFTSSVSSKTLDLWDKQQSRFSELFHLLLLLDEGPSPSPPPGVPPTLTDHVILPIELLLEPLRKRFKFHFYGEKKTNSKEKVAASQAIL